MAGDQISYKGGLLYGRASILSYCVGRQEVTMIAITFGFNLENSHYQNETVYS